MHRLMKSVMQRPHAAALVLLTLIFVSLNLFSNIALRTARLDFCLLYTSPSPRDLSTSRMPSSA